MHRKGIVVMGKLIGLVKPMLHIMLLAILLGVAGNLCAISITALGGYAIIAIMGKAGSAVLSLKGIIIILCAVSVLRGIMRYGEQVCNHYIAFKILDIIRHRVFSVLRKLAPAKLEGKDKGNLISLITSDIELLEVFYAHYHLTDCYSFYYFPTIMLLPWKLSLGIWNDWGSRLYNSGSDFSAVHIQGRKSGGTILSKCLWGNEQLPFRQP